MTFNITSKELEHIIEIRHHLHRHPEVSWHEIETTKYIRECLSQIDGVEILEMGLNTGVIARIEAANSGKCVALRADIDALPLDEAWKSPYKSQNVGCAHGCGHDFHTSSLIGAAKILARMRYAWKGSVILIFQPAEETTDGAQVIIRTGVFEKYPIEAVFGLHNRPEVETGKVVVKPAPLMAAKYNFRIVVHGVGGHGSMPHKCIDPIVCAAGIVQNVLTVGSRNIDPMKSLVLSICSIHGGTPDNLIMDKVEMTGSMRYLDPEVGARALERLKSIVQFTAQTFECTADFEIVESVHAVINSQELLDVAQKAAHAAMGPDAIVESPSCLATEDFAEYMQIVPGFFFWLGNRKPGDEVYSWHNAKFHTDDDALKYGCQLLANCVALYN